jgi:pyrroloquinoline quinone biosynthesis protein B
MIVTVLGSGSNGGIPQWDCCCLNCTLAREKPFMKKTRSSITVSLDGGQQVLIDASPDLKMQLETSGFIPKANEATSYRQSRIEAVLLTHGHGDHTIGIAEFSTGKGFDIPVYGPKDLISFLFGSHEKSNYFGELGRLSRNYVNPRHLKEDETLELLNGLKITGFKVDHTDQLEDGTFFPSSTFGYEIEDDGKKFVYTPDLGKLTDNLLDRISGAELFMLDATFWWNDELSRISGINKTSHELGHIPVEESMRMLENLDIDRVMYTHLNHTNPLFNSEHHLSNQLKKTGFEVAHDNTVIYL